MSFQIYTQLNQKFFINILKRIGKIIKVWGEGLTSAKLIKKVLKQDLTHMEKN